MTVAVLNVFETDIFEDAIFADFTSDTVDRLDITDKIVFIKTDVVTFHPVEDLYREVRSIRHYDESTRVMNNPVSAQGNEIAGQNFTPRRAVLNDGWRIGFENPINGTVTITGEMISDDGLAGAQLVKLEYLPSGVSMLINYAPPSSEVIVVNNAMTDAHVLMVEELWRRNGLDPNDPALLSGDGKTSKVLQTNGFNLTFTPTGITRT
jgi:hypothetical protein